MPATPPPPEFTHRTFAEIMADLRLRIPRVLPEWTDHNVSDPGIALLELFAAMAESLHWRLDQVPDELWIKLLEVLNARPAPAQPARAEVTFEPDKVPLVRPAPGGTRIAAANPQGGDPVVFETDEDVSIVASPLVAVQVYDGAGFVDATEKQADPAGAYFPFGRTPQPGNALYLGFEPKPQAQGPLFPADVRFQLFLPPAQTAGRPQSLPPDEGVPPPAVPLARFVFEYRNRADLVAWREARMFDDATHAFVDEGALRIAGPTDSTPTVEGVIDRPLHWLRCRLVQTLYPAGHAPEIEGLVPNTVPASALTTALGEVAGEGNGRPNQTLRLRSAPVVIDTLQLADSQGTQWQRIDDLRAAGADDPVFMLDPGTGTLTFGDGEHGRIPAAGVELVAIRYRYGGGTEGNVGTGAIKDILSPLTGVRSASNRRPAQGGAAAETVDELRRRAPSILRTRDRAITVEDYAELAERFGQVSKAIALPLVHPGYPGLDVPGSVTVVIVPDGEDREPQPSADLLRAVLASLAGKRAVGVELHVKGPTLTRIGVDARLDVAPEASFARVVDDARAGLDRFLAAREWPFGRDFDPTRLYGILLEVKDVRGVPALSIRVDGVPWDEIQKPVILPPDGLVCPAEHQLVPTPAVDL